MQIKEQLKLILALSAMFFVMLFVFTFITGTGVLRSFLAGIIPGTLLLAYYMFDVFLQKRASRADCSDNQRGDLKESKACPDCGNTMESGFIPDASTFRFCQSTWYSGMPEASHFFGIKSGPPQLICRPERQIPMTAYRCTQCGVIKTYAIEKDKVNL